MEAENIKMVKLSTCPKCNNMVRAGIPDRLGDEFWKEVKKYKLNVKDVTLENFNNSDYNFCKC